MHRTAVRIVGLLVPLFAAAWVAADTTVTVEQTHLCCNSCVKGVAKAVSSVSGATAKCDMKAATITITAPDEATAQKAVDAIAAAGYDGKVTGATIKDDSGATAGNVKSVTVSGFHNCCGKCTKAINATIKKAGGTGEVAAKGESVTITGDIDEAKLVEAFKEAGFHVKVSK